MEKDILKEEETLLNIDRELDKKHKTITLKMERCCKDLQIVDWPEMVKSEVCEKEKLSDLRIPASAKIRLQHAEMKNTKNSFQEVSLQCQKLEKQVADLSKALEESAKENNRKTTLLGKQDRELEKLRNEVRELGEKTKLLILENKEISAKVSKSEQQALKSQEELTCLENKFSNLKNLHERTTFDFNQKLQAEVESRRNLEKKCSEERALPTQSQTEKFLLRVLKKNNQIIENLKNQNLYLEASKMLAFTQEEFSTLIREN